MIDPLKKPEGISWDAASLELPDIPMLPAGQDALSATISAVLPTLAAPLAANVATLQAKENMFSGKLGAAQAAYQNSDDAGSQSVGQIVGMLGQQAGQMGQMAGAPAQAIGGQTGMFGSLMQQAMQAAQGSGAGGQSTGGQAGASSVAGQVPSPGAAGAAGPAPQPREEAVGPKDDQPHEPQPDKREPLHRAETDDRAMAGPSDDSRHSAGPAPVKSPEHPRHSSEDLGRRM
jgi:hypothetical protein